MAGGEEAGGDGGGGRCLEAEVDEKDATKMIAPSLRIGYDLGL